MEDIEMAVSITCQ